MPLNRRSFYLFGFYRTTKGRIKTQISTGIHPKRYDGCERSMYYDHFTPAIIRDDITGRRFSTARLLAKDECDHRMTSSGGDESTMLQAKLDAGHVRCKFNAMTPWRMAKNQADLQYLRYMYNILLNG